MLHIVPDLQAHQTIIWIIWQRLGTVILRILFVWLYNNTGKSVFVTVVFHAMTNVSFALFPNYGSHYDPFFVSLIMAFTTIIVIFAWGPETLSRHGYALRSG
jgi:glycerol uptake facilitator-like aquaporin